MANTFGGIPLFDPRHARDYRARFRRDAEPLLAKANSLYVPSGLWPARGWLLVRRQDYNTLNKYGTNFTLAIDDGFHAQLSLSKLAIVQARCVTRGVAGDKNAIYLVEVTDARGAMWNQWFQAPTTSQYNAPSPAYPSQYYTLTLDGGAPWTWTRLIQDLWGQLPLLGGWPGLPIAPAGTPTAWLFPGCSCWEALCRTLEQVGCTVAPDLQSGAYRIVQVGAADGSFAAATTAYANFLEDDYEWIDTGSGRVPGSVKVFFHRRNEYYGTEETVRRDALQWQTTPLYSVTVAAPGFFTGAAGIGYLWDDFQVRYDIDGSPLAADVATAATIAAERVQQYYDQIYRGTVGSLRRVYAGALPFRCGEQVDGVCWRMDFRDSTELSWRTEVVRGECWPEVLQHARSR